MRQTNAPKAICADLWTILFLSFTLLTAIPFQGKCNENPPQTHSEVQPDQGFDDGDFAVFEDDMAEKAVFLRDPFEPVNRAIFTFNDKAYFWVIKPVAKGYNVIAPTPVRKGVRNLFDNLEFPVRFVNCILQGKAKGSGVELSRFLLNSTIGILGLWDPAHYFFHLEPKKESLDQTLGKYGVGNGFYIVLPLLGPSTLRDSVGLIGDSFLKPVSYVEPYGLSLAISTYKNFNAISFRIGDYEAMKDAAIDPYNAFKDAYLKYMNHQVAE